jgi:putative membrane protein
MPSDPPLGPVGGHPQWAPHGWAPPPAPEPVELGCPPQRTSPLTVAFGAIAIATGLVFLWLESLVPDPPGQDPEPPVTVWFAAFFLVVRGLREMAVWWARTYRLTTDQLIIDEGLLTRHHRVVPFERVQQADVTQSLLGRLVGLCALRFDTAGESGSTSVLLRLLDHRRADALRVYALRRRAELTARRLDGGATAPGGSATAATGPAPAGWPDPRPTPDPTGFAPPTLQLARLTAGQLVLVAATSPVVASGAIAVALGTVVVGAIGLRSGDVAVLAGFASTAVMAGFFVAFNAAAFVTRLWDLTVEVTGDDLRLRHGMVQVRSLTMPRRRVQHVSVTATPLQRLFGFVGITLHSATPLVANGANTGEAPGPPVFSVPFVRDADLAAMLDRLLGPGWSVPPLTPRNDVARRRAVRRRSMVLALASLPALFAGPSAVLLVVAMAAVGALWGIAAHRRAGWARAEGLVVFAHGVLLHRTELVPVARVQSSRVTASVFQRRAGLATVHLDVAGRSSPHLYDLERGTADDLAAGAPFGFARVGATPA